MKVYTLWGYCWSGGVWQLPVWPCWWTACSPVAGHCAGDMGSCLHPMMLLWSSLNFSCLLVSLSFFLTSLSSFSSVSGCTWGSFMLGSLAGSSSMWEMPVWSSSGAGRREGWPELPLEQQVHIMAASTQLWPCAHGWVQQGNRDREVMGVTGHYHNFSYITLPARLGL